MSEKGLIIRNGFVYDPESGVLGERMDLLLQGNKIVEKLDEKGAEVVNASNMVVMPAGIDIHSHASEIDVRTLLPDYGLDPMVEGNQLTGRLYSQLGYSTIVEPSVSLSEAEDVRERLSRMNLDKMSLISLANEPEALEYISQRDFSGLNVWAHTMLKKGHGYGIKAVNPGGVYAWKQGKAISSLDDVLPRYDITPREIISSLISVCEKLKLRHPLHLHTNNLGVPGNYETAIDSLGEGRMHIAHLQFSSYGGNTWQTFRSEAEKVASEINKRKNITADVGQVIFGKAAIVTADSQLKHILLNKEGMATVHDYSKKSGVNAIQWAIGLELALLIRDPWRIYITTDHPNGGPFIHYPKIIAWLMDKNYRNQVLGECHKWASERTTLAALDKELTLTDIVIMTRAGPAKALGLNATLSPGNKANVAIYALNPEEHSGDKIESAFSRTAYTIKDGEIVARDGVILKEKSGNYLSLLNTNS